MEQQGGKHQGEDLTRSEISDRIGLLLVDIERIDEALETLRTEKTNDNLSVEEFMRRKDILEQQRSIAGYNRDRYLAML